MTRVELRYQDGDRTELHRKQGYLLYAVPLRHFARRHRLEEIVSYDRTGRVLSTRTLPVDRPGLYPCTDPTVNIDGVRMCP